MMVTFYRGTNQTSPITVNSAQVEYVMPSGNASYPTTIKMAGDTIPLTVRDQFDDVIAALNAAETPAP